MQLVNRPFAITLALLAAFGASTSAVAKVHVPEKLASGVFAINYDGSAPVDDAGTLDCAGRNERCSYELVSGRPKWLSRDPIGIDGGPNLYAFVSNDAVNHIDVDGLQQYYDTQDAAGHAGAQAASAQTASQPKGEHGRVEYCGRICKSCKDGKTKYYYTGPIRGIDTQAELDRISAEWTKKLGKPFTAGGGCEPTKAPACSGKDEFVAEYHSHPNGQTPSKGDKDRAKDTGRPDYVGRGSTPFRGTPRTDRANPDGTVTPIREPVPQPIQ